MMGKTIALAIAALTLSACSHTPIAPEIQIRTVTIEKPIPVSCVKPEQIAPEPEKIGSKLQCVGKKPAACGVNGLSRDRDLYEAIAKLWRARSIGQEALLQGCLIRR